MHGNSAATDKQSVLVDRDDVRYRMQPVSQYLRHVHQFRNVQRALQLGRFHRLCCRDERWQRVLCRHC